MPAGIAEMLSGMMGGMGGGGMGGMGGMPGMMGMGGEYLPASRHVGLPLQFLPLPASM